MKSEFEKARDEANKYLYIDPIKQSFVDIFDEGADWAYEWLDKEWNAMKQDRDMFQKENERLKKEKKILIGGLKGMPSWIEFELLEMSAWMGIPEKKRLKQVEYHMENIDHLVKRVLTKAQELEKQESVE